MKRISIGNEIEGSVIALGCMRISGMETPAAAGLINTALESGIDFFDHADIYGGGKSEEVFAAALSELKVSRGDVIIQTKCGIRPGMFDFSKQYIISAVEGSLRRLGTDYIDVLLLHRPDALMEPDEVAAAFDLLHAAGKVRHFGVSNQNALQMQLLQKSVRQKLIANQLQFSLTNTGMIDRSLNVNMQNAASVDHDGGILDYCRLHDITIQPWSPMQYGFFGGVFLGSDQYPELNRTISRLAEQYGVTDAAIAIAWILRHPARMQPVIGTTNAGRVKDIAAAAGISLIREQWYELYRAAGNVLP